jgi:hypothetical protein
MASRSQVPLVEKGSFWLTSLACVRRRQLTPEPLGAKLFNLALKTLDLLDRISGGHEFVGALIWLNGAWAAS